MIDARLIWPNDDLEAAVTALLVRARLGDRQASASNYQTNCKATPAERIARRASGCEVVPIQTIAAKLPNELAASCPVIVQLDNRGFLALWKVKRGRFRLIKPDGRLEDVAVETVCAALRSVGEKNKRSEYETLLAGAGLNRINNLRAIEGLLDEQFGRRPFQHAWAIREPIGGASLKGFLRQAGVYRNSVWLMAAHLAEYLLWLAAWGVMGQVAFSGQMDRGWLSGWGLLLLTTIPFRVATTWLQGVLAIQVGRQLKRRLLEGALKLDRDAVRHQGTGSFLGQALESEAVESLALSGGVMSLLAIVELVIAGFVMGSISILLVIWCCFSVVIAWRFYNKYRRWTGKRMTMTGSLVENMTGHRTRNAQMPAEQLHSEEDAALNDYFARSTDVDGAGMWLVSVLPRGWLIAGLLWLVPAAMAGSSAGPALAIKLGGVLLAFTAFKKLSASGVEIVAATVAAGRIAPLFRAATQDDAHYQALGNPGAPRTGEQLLEADRLTFRYRDVGDPVLHPTSLAVRRGEKILLEGSSGGGKTTLASLLSGMREPASGLLLLQGLDVHTIGPQRWRQRIAAAPQFHENYILTDTLAANLLLGRPGPRCAQDMQDAEDVCRELGLGDLLERMPGGIEQMVGEGGWQLSHGERSRIYVARALLQRADLVLLDESFGALDPENLQRSLTSSLALAETLLVIAHP